MGDSKCCDGLQETMQPVDIKKRMAAEGINISVSAAPSTLLDFQARDLQAVARASVHYYNTEEEIVNFVAALKRLSAGDGESN